MPLGKNKATNVPGRTAMDVCEEAMHLLRHGSMDFYLRYAMGVVPFILALLFFWSDMSGSAFARQHVVSASVGMVGVFVWMNGGIR